MPLQVGTLVIALFEISISRAINATCEVISWQHRWKFEYVYYYWQDVASTELLNVTKNLVILFSDHWQLADYEMLKTSSTRRRPHLTDTRLQT